MVPDDIGSWGGRKERSFSSNLFTVLEEEAIGVLGWNLSRGVGLYNAFVVDVRREEMIKLCIWKQFHIYHQEQQWPQKRQKLVK